MPPYNTRRKSLSLSELGIILPKRSRVSEQQQQNPSPPETVVEGGEPPVKRSKRAHTSDSSSLGLMSPPRTTTIRIKEEKSKVGSALSPPPSPATEDLNTIDTEGINDDIVVATIQQLERTGNRPHLVKELAAILATDLHAEQNPDPDVTSATLRMHVANKLVRSANPCALISSRLTAYLNRPWPAISPCPLAKDLSSVHPRRLYFFLTTMTRQPIPDVAEPLPTTSRIISPSLSSASADGEDRRFARGRQAMSPSPEVDLSSPELDDSNPDAPSTPGASFSGRNSIPRDRPAFTHPQRATSPQLEHEERDFKQTASQLYEQAQAQRNSQQDVSMSDHTTAESDAASVTMSIEADESEESAARKNSEAAAALFGPVEHLRFPFLSPPSPSVAATTFGANHMDFSSPLLPPQPDDTRPSYHLSKPLRTDEFMEPMVLGLGSKDMLLPDSAFAWDHLEVPENVELEELENMFDAY